MGKDIDFNSKKFLILLLIICVAFLVLIIKAFEYLPNTDNTLKPLDSSEVNRSIEVPESTENTESTETADASSEEAKPEKKTLNIKLPQPNDMDIELVEPPVGINPDMQAQNITKAEQPAENKEIELTPEQKTAQCLYSANRYRIGGKYESALMEYLKVPSLTDDKSSIAASYEGIASIYAARHKYGSALSYATRAYNMSPSSSRELLLARLYYKTGDMEKATRRINNILHRDFSDDR